LTPVDLMTELTLISCCRPLGAPTLSDEEADSTAALFKALADPSRVKIVNLLVRSAGPVCACEFEPALGLTLNRFFGVDRNLGADQQETLFTLAGSFSLEWSTDWIAILGAVSLPYGWDVGGKQDQGGANPLHPGWQPWSVGLGVTMSPF